MSFLKLANGGPVWYNPFRMTLPPQFLKVAATLQLPLALAFVGLIALDMHLGWGLGDATHLILAALAGAMGVKRPSELAERAAKALDEASDAGK